MTDTERATGETLARVLRLIDESGTGSAVPRALVSTARQRALELAAASTPNHGASPLAVLDFSAELLCAIAVDLAAHPRAAERLVARIEELTGIQRTALGREVLRAPPVAQLPAKLATEVQLKLLQLFTATDSVSLWALWPSGDLRHVSGAGELDLDARATRGLARSLLEGGPAPKGESGDLVGVAVPRGPDHHAALIARGPAPTPDHRALLLDAAAPVLASVLDREELSEREASSESSAVEALQNRLARLRFDLHDGPQQDVHLLAEDVRLFRDQLAPSVAGQPDAERLIGRIDDLEAQLVALDGDLRRVSQSLQSPFLPPGSLPDALRQLTDAFASRTGIEPRTSLTGDLTQLTDSQQITLLALIREALSNVREHSQASDVSITVFSHAGGVDAEVADDGIGFEPEATLVKAARDGHLGLVGIHERVRLLGGQARIDSRPGGPTTVSIKMPAWQRPAPPDAD